MAGEASAWTNPRAGIASGARAARVQSGRTSMARNATAAAAAGRNDLAGGSPFQTVKLAGAMEAEHRKLGEGYYAGEGVNICQVEEGPGGAICLAGQRGNRRLRDARDDPD